MADHKIVDKEILGAFLVEDISLWKSFGKALEGILKRVCTEGKQKATAFDELFSAMSSLVEFCDIMAEISQKEIDEGEIKGILPVDNISMFKGFRKAIITMLERVYTQGKQKAQAWDELSAAVFAQRDFCFIVAETAVKS